MKSKEGVARVSFVVPVPESPSLPTPPSSSDMPQCSPRPCSRSHFPHFEQARGLYVDFRLLPLLSFAQTHLENTSQSQNQSRTSTNEEDGGDVERERDRGVGGEDEGSDSGDGVERLESLGEGKDASVDDGANGGVVVKGDQGIHLESVEEDCQRRREGRRGQEL